MPTIILIFGAFSAGKSYLVSSLKEDYGELFLHIPGDGTSDTKLESLLRDNTVPMIVHDRAMKVTTFYKKYSSQFKIIPVFLSVDEETLRRQMAMRHGEWTDNVLRRKKRCEVIAKRLGAFTGGFSECRAYISSLLCS